MNKANSSGEYSLTDGICKYFFNIFCFFFIFWKFLNFLSYIPYYTLTDWVLENGFLQSKNEVAHTRQHDVYKNSKKNYSTNLWTILWIIWTLKCLGLHLLHLFTYSFYIKQKGPLGLTNIMVTGSGKNQTVTYQSFVYIGQVKTLGTDSYRKILKLENNICSYFETIRLWTHWDWDECVYTTLQKYMTKRYHLLRLKMGRKITTDIGSWYIWWIFKYLVYTYGGIYAATSKI